MFEKIDQPMAQKKQVDVRKNMDIKSREFFLKYLDLLEKDRPYIDTFAGIYGEKVIKADKEFVEKRRAEKDEATIRGEILEGVFYEQAELSNWFGQDSHLIALTKYDDYKGSDFVLEIETKSGKIIRLAMDITTSTNRERLKGKLQQSLDLTKKKLFDIKYFRSEIEPDKEFKSGLRNIPRVVVGIDANNLEGLCLDIFEKGNKQANNPVQFLVLDEIFKQLVLQEKVCLNNRFDFEILEKIREAKVTIEKILEEKENLLPNGQKVMHDKTFEILNALS